MAAPGADLNENSHATMVDVLSVAEQMEANAISYVFLDQIEGFAEWTGIILALTDTEINEAVFTIPDPAGSVILFIHQGWKYWNERHFIQYKLWHLKGCFQSEYSLQYEGYTQDC